ncbi:hypothetical protein ACWGSK_00320 [Nocardiopsis sp. NPDC055551]
MLVIDVIVGERGHGPAFSVDAFGVEGVDEHEPGHLFQVHFPDEVVDPFLDRQAPVLIGVEFSVVVQVPEVGAVDIDHVLDA